MALGRKYNRIYLSVTHSHIFSLAKIVKRFAWVIFRLGEGIVWHVHVTQVSVTGDNASIESTYVRFLRSKKFTPPNLFLSGAAVQAYISTLLYALHPFLCLPECECSFFL